VHIPYTAETRPDTGVTNPQLGIWLFLASELMLFGSLFSSYALLRSGAASWPDQSTLVSVRLGAVNTVVLLVSSFTFARARTLTALLAQSRVPHGVAHRARAHVAVTMLLGFAFLGIKGTEYGEKLAAGLHPATNNFLGLYYALTGLHALHLAGGLLVLGYLWGPGARMREQEPLRYSQRVGIAALYWHFVDALWISIFVVLYLL
jgi:cytochrome c oxidase subunit III